MATNQADVELQLTASGPVAVNAKIPRLCWPGLGQHVCRA